MFAEKKTVEKGQREMVKKKSYLSNKTQEIMESHGRLRSGMTWYIEKHRA